jgi:mRNA-degrading endonuclease toxin of MazEF toxin-antitoxin module
MLRAPHPLSLRLGDDGWRALEAIDVQRLDAREGRLDAQEMRDVDDALELMLALA